jgi:hypothetical protein
MMEPLSGPPVEGEGISKILENSENKRLTNNWDRKEFKTINEGLNEDARGES